MKIALEMPPDTDGQTLWTVEVMRDLILADLDRPEILELASRIAQPTADATAASIFQFFRQPIRGKKRFRFKPDPPQVELLKNPAQHAANILKHGVTNGDCDESSSLVAALLEVCGGDSFLSVIDDVTKPAKKFAHVFACWRRGDESIAACDPQEGYFVRWPNYRRAWTLPIDAK